MKKVRNSIVINATPEQVWEMIAADHLPQWQPSLAKVQPCEYRTAVNTLEDRFKPGTVANFDVTCFHEVVESIPSSRLVYKIYEKTVFAYFEGYRVFQLEPVKHGTKLVHSTEFVKPTGIRRFIFFNFILRKWLKNKTKKELKVLKSLLEEGTIKSGGSNEKDSKKKRKH